LIICYSKIKNRNQKLKKTFIKIRIRINIITFMMLLMKEKRVIKNKVNQKRKIKLHKKMKIHQKNNKSLYKI